MRLFDTLLAEEKSINIFKILIDYFELCLFIIISILMKFSLKL